MRVVHIIKAKGIAGAERHLLDLMEGLRRHDVEVQLLLLTEDGHSAGGIQAAAESRGVPVQRLTMNRHIAPGLFNRLHQTLRDLKPDIVHTHLQHADFYGIPAAKLAGVPKVISSQHNDDSRRRNPLLRLINGGLWRLADKVITISEAVRRFTLEVERLNPDKVQTIHYGLPLPVALCAGSLRHHRARFSRYTVRHFRRRAAASGARIAHAAFDYRKPRPFSRLAR
jgi:glycosyltransferase involved in cell wall biosynthesis